MSNNEHEWKNVFKWFFKCYKCNCLKVVADTGTTTYYPYPDDHATKGLETEPVCKQLKNKSDD